MIQGILTFEFVLNLKEGGEIEPEFQPIQFVFQVEEFSRDNFSDLINNNDIFGIFYQHTTGVNVSGEHSNFYTGRLKETPFKVISYFKQALEGSKYLTISIFSLEDEIEIYEELIKNLTIKLDPIYETLEKARITKQVSLLSNINKKLEEELKFTIFQIERLIRLDKLQKVALIFISDERIKILKTLREFPISKREMRNTLEKIFPNPNIDVLIEPFLELNLVRRDWIKGVRDAKIGRMKHQGEYLFLTKDIVLAQIPNKNLIKHLKDSKNKLYPKYEQRVIEFFSKYNHHLQPIQETKKIASLLLNPDIYDFFALMRKNYYPLDKIPKILSAWADTSIIIDELKKLNILTEIKDEKNKSWLFLLTDIKPLIIYPLFLLPKIKEAYKMKKREGKTTYEIAKKAMDLLEVTYPEKIEF